MENRRAFIEKLVKDAKEIIVERINENYDIGIKENNRSDLVTAVDIEVEKFLVSKITKEYPTDSFLTEEKTVETVDSDYMWIIDPIDGTMNFVYTLRDFAISIALYHKGVGVLGVVYDVMADEMIVGIKGEGVYVNGKKAEAIIPVTLKETIADISLRTIKNLIDRDIADLTKLPDYALSHRNLGSAALRIVHIALNRVHLYVADKLCTWDIAAAVIILEELGGSYKIIEHDTIPFNSKSFSFMASNSDSLTKEFKEKLSFQ